MHRRRATSGCDRYRRAFTVFFADLPFPFPFPFPSRASTSLPNSFVATSLNISGSMSGPIGAVSCG